LTSAKRRQEFLVMRVRVCTISWNESRVIDYFLRHYESIAEHIVFYHEDSTDGTTEAGGGPDRRTWTVFAVRLTRLRQTKALQAS
jgi:hypothetical protein